MRPWLLAGLLLALGLLCFLVLRGRGAARHDAAPAGPAARAPARILAADSEEMIAERQAFPVPAGRAPLATSAAAGGRAAGEAVLFGARLIDERGRPLGSGRLAWLERSATELFRERRSSAAERSGAVWLAVERGELPAGEPLLLAAGGPARARTLVRVEPGRWSGLEQVSLGELTLVPGGDVAGRVVDARGAPVAGAWVIVAREWGAPAATEREALRVWGALEPLEGFAAFAASGPDGRFAIEGVPGGGFAVVVRSGPRSELFLPGRVEPVEVRPGETTELADIALQGPDEDEVIAGVVLASDGTPLAGASVALGDESGTRRFTGALTSPAGRFELLVPRGMAVRVSARAAGHGGVEVPGVRGGDRDVVLRLERLSEAVRAALEAPASPEAPAPGPSRPAAEATLHGRLTLGGEAPGSWSVTVEGSRPALLDQDGEFWLRGLRPGRRWLNALSGHSGQVRVGLALPVDLAEGANEWSLDLPVGAVRFEELPAVEPSDELPGYELTWREGDRHWQALFHARADRTAELDAVPAGRLTLRARAAGAEPGGQVGFEPVAELELAAGERRTVRLR